MTELATNQRNRRASGPEKGQQRATLCHSCFFEIHDTLCTVCWGKLDKGKQRRPWVVAEGGIVGKACANAKENRDSLRAGEKFP